MHIERLFNALVLGGAAIGMGCSEDASPVDERPSESNAGGRGDGGSGAGAVGGTAGSGSGSTGGSGELADASGTPGRAGGGGEPGEADAASGECSAIPTPSDPCGCPCCWVDNCMNDEPCCESFCAAGDDDKGCCGP